MPLCDTLLRLAAAELFEPFWSEKILEEVRRNLVADWRSSAASAAIRLDRMRKAFPEAIVEGYDSIISAMPNHPKDRHVLAAAVKARADQLVTSNTKDFDDENTAKIGIEIRTPDDFLQNVLDLYPKETIGVLHAQAAALQRPTLTVDDVLRGLSRTAPTFSELARRQL